MKDLNETLRRKSPTFKPTLYFFSINSICPRATICLYFCKFYVEELLALVLRVNLISPLF